MTERTKRRLQEMEEAVQQANRPTRTLEMNILGANGSVAGSKTIQIRLRSRRQGEHSPHLEANNTGNNE